MIQGLRFSLTVLWQGGSIVVGWNSCICSQHGVSQYCDYLSFFSSCCDQYPGKGM